MRVRVKKTKKKFAMMPCGCCERVYYKERSLDRQTLKEVIEELNGEAVVTG